MYAGYDMHVGYGMYVEKWYVGRKVMVLHVGWGTIGSMMGYVREYEGFNGGTFRVGQR